MTKGELMKLIYTPDELCNIDSAIPQEIYSEPGFNSWEHIMNYNDSVFGKLQNMTEIAKQRDIILPV